jgi:glyoxylase-like metal-dependent hydrolase (beta-lactamase superfamily II)
MIGDYYRNFGYPFIDLNNGGSLKGMLEALDATYKMAAPDTRLIPGHGTTITRADLIPYRDMVQSVATSVQQLIAQGKSLQEVIAAHPTGPYDSKVPGGLLPAAGSTTSADRFVSELYQDLKGGR